MIHKYHFNVTVQTDKDSSAIERILEKAIDRDLPYFTDSTEDIDDPIVEVSFDGEDLEE